MDLTFERISELTLSAASGVGRRAVMQLIDHDAKCPYISLRAVEVLDEAFGSHVDGRPDADILELMTS